MSLSRKTIKSGKSTGQVLVLVALIFLGLMAAIGLAVDTGMVFVNYANLRRAIDAAALGAATQYRMNVPVSQLASTAIEYLNLNNVEDPSATVTVCDPAAGVFYEAGLCPSGENRKLVHVRASTTVRMNFISLIGFNNITVSADSVAEAASLDVILVLDTSESMTFGEPKNNAAAHGGVDMRDPRNCNAADPGGADGYPGDCHPFQEVKAAAVDFVNHLYFPYDRVGVITFDRWANSATRLDLTNDKSAIINYIKNRQVTPWMQLCPYANADKSLAGPCADYTTYTYYTMGCTYYTKEYYDSSVSRDPSNFDAATCGTTNIGEGMNIARQMFAATGIMRQNSLWVIILLTDGAANASVSIADPNNPGPLDLEYYGYCPGDTKKTQPFCRDPWSDPYSAIHRHSMSDLANYDSADYAYDMVDKAADRDPVADVARNLIYTIGLGKLVTQNEACWDYTVNPPTGAANGKCDPEAGQKLLEYAANQGDGTYYYAPTTNQLTRVFQMIAENIAFRLTH